MEIGNMDIKRLSPEKKQRYNRGKLCFQCGKKGCRESNRKGRKPGRRLYPKKTIQTVEKYLLQDLSGEEQRSR